ncbi:MAG: glycosyl hydrolase family 65 protein [Pirellulales bacterium]
MIDRTRTILPCFLPTVLLLAAAPLAAQDKSPRATFAAVPDDFPRFVVPGHEEEMARLRELYWLHYQPAGPLIPLWDEWMPMSTLWPARGEGAQLQAMRARWAGALAGRGINAEGYVLTHQHDGPAHAEGWPFPLWTQAGGIGWHFAPIGVPGYEAPRATPDGWKLTGANGGALVEKGWPIELAAPGAVAQSPAFAVEARLAPWLRLNWWAAGLERADCYVEWTTKDAPDFGPDRRVYFSPAAAGSDGKLDLARGETRTMIPVYRLPGWKGTITGLRIGFDNPGPASVVIKSFHTASDTRHNINNPNFIRACHDYFAWSGDLAFLRGQIGRIRTAMRFTQREFDTRRRKCVYTTWPGHEGRSGVRVVDGKKVIVPGEGIGSNYWDLLPFGGEDALATIYYYDALGDLADLEEQIAAHPEWNIAAADAFEPGDLRRHAQEVKDYGTKRFWNPKTGRFGTVDLDGNLHDYGFTFLNNEAVYYGFATGEQARSIQAWIAGQRVVEGDTSTAADIYHWRFGPRSTTRRNLDYYFWGWSGPESVPWGYQVQDGGAVLGFSYHDLMARLQTAGPDDAWQRLGQILAWFSEVEAAGGYRAYYKDPSRGTMQGGNVPGGLGLDKEFFESILVPQVMLYGFLGLRPSAAGCTIDPRLPSDWKELAVTRIHLRDHVLDIRATADAVEITDRTPSARPLAIEVASPRKLKIVAP